MFSQAKATMPAPLATLHGVVFDILVGGEKRVGVGSSPSSLSLRSSYAGHASPFVLRVAAPRLARRAKRGGPGRTRTCNQTAMSAGFYREIRAKSAFLDQNHSRLCAFVHGVSAG